jgi:hypothetical protein
MFAQATTLPAENRSHLNGSSQKVPQARVIPTRVVTWLAASDRILALHLRGTPQEPKPPKVWLLLIPAAQVR